MMSEGGCDPVTVGGLYKALLSVYITLICDVLVIEFESSFDVNIAMVTSAK